MISKRRSAPARSSSEYDNTTVVRPGWSASLDGWNNIVMTKDDV